MLKNKSLHTAIVIILSLFTSLVVYNFLPAFLEQRNGEINLPKYLFVLISFVASVVFSIFYRSANKKKYIFVAMIIGIITPIYTLFFGNITNIPIF